MPNVVPLCVVMLSVIRLNVVAPKRLHNGENTVSGHFKRWAYFNLIFYLNQTRKHCQAQN